MRQLLDNLFARWRYESDRGVFPGDKEVSLRAALQWLCAAQDATGAGGVARAYSLRAGWELPYPETTGYIIPTLLALDGRFPDLHLADRAWRAGKWLAEIQFDSGAICSKQHRPGNTKPSVFNTGMVLHGWVSLLEWERAGGPSTRETRAQAPAQALTRPAGTLSRPSGEGGGEAGRAESGDVVMQQALTGLSDTLSRPAGEGWGEGKPRLLAAAQKAVDWLIQEQEPEGSWVKNAFNATAHTYYTMVDWALIRYAALARDERSREAAVRNLEWTLRQQRPNGWFDRCWFITGDPVTTHTLSYTTQGLVEAALLLGSIGEAHSPLSALRSPLSEPHQSLLTSAATPIGAEGMKFVEAAVRATEPLRRYFEQHGTLPGTFDENWRPTAAWECCTGSAQTSLVWQSLGKITGDLKWIEAARQLNQRLLRYQKVGCRLPGINGAIPGSWPISGGYDRHAFPNHAAKFHIDALAAQS